MFSRFDTIPACDGQTDGRPCYSYNTCFSIDDARKNEKNVREKMTGVDSVLQMRRQPYSRHRHHHYRKSEAAVKQVSCENSPVPDVGGRCRSTHSPTQKTSVPVQTDQTENTAVCRDEMGWVLAHHVHA